MHHDDLDRVVPLDELDDFRVASGDPDPRGWEVVAADGRKIGEVDDLLVDPSAMKVRYLDVDLDDEVDARGEDRHVLVPIGYARIDRDHDRVLVEQLSAADLRAIPAYDHGPLTRDYETSLRDSYLRHPRRSVDAGRRREAEGQEMRRGEMREERIHEVRDERPREEAREREPMRPARRDEDFYADDDLFDESTFWAARRSTGLGGALGDIGADPGYPGDVQR